MTRFAVVGHVEWIEFALVSHVPVPGEIIDARSGFHEAAGSAAVAAVQLAKLAGGVDFFTALGDDERGRRSHERLRELGVTVHAAWRDAATRWGFVHLDDDGERTITVVGDRLAPHGADDLPWDRLEGAHAGFVSRGDAAAGGPARGAPPRCPSPGAPRPRGATPAAPGCSSPRRGRPKRWAASTSTCSWAAARTGSSRSSRSTRRRAWRSGLAARRAASTPAAR